MEIRLPNELKYIRDVDDVAYGMETYKEGLVVPNINLKYGSIYSKLKSMPSFGKYLIGSLRELNKSVSHITLNPYLGKSKISYDELEELERIIKDNGIIDIGYTKVEVRHMFQKSIVLYKNAIVLVMDMNKDKILMAPSKETIREIFRTYYELGRTVNLISDKLREMGYNAQAIPAIGSNINLTVLAKDAGLGGFGKNGLIITKGYGPGVRLAAVLTDIDNLPLSDKDEFNWISDYCDTCNNCVRKCPASAIYIEPTVFDDGSETHIDYKKCAVPFSRDYGCTLCIRECTFYKLGYDKVKSIHESKLYK